MSGALIGGTPILKRERSHMAALPDRGNWPVRRGKRMSAREQAGIPWPFDGRPHRRIDLRQGEGDNGQFLTKTIWRYLAGRQAVRSPNREPVWK